MVSSLTAPNKYQKCNQFTHLEADLAHLHVAAWLLPATGTGKERMNQARLLGETRYSVLHTPMHKIYASGLKRAHSTAVQLVAPRTSLPDSDKDPLSFPPIHTTPLLREHHVGIAEGTLWFAGPVSEKKQQQQRRRASAHDNDDEKLLDPEDGVEVYVAIQNRYDRLISGE